MHKMMFSTLQSFSLFSYIVISLLLHGKLANCESLNTSSETVRRKRVAIIGGGVSGSFTAKYIADYDINCELDSLVIFDPFCISGCKGSDNNVKSSSSSAKVIPTTKLTSNEVGQGSRVSHVELSDGTIVEIGGSVIYSGNKLVVDMMNGNNDKQKNLVAARPFDIGRPKKETEEGEELPSGLGIYNGGNKWFLVVKSLLANFNLLWRYNFDLLRVSRDADRMINAFNKIYQILESTSSDTFLESPNEIWSSVGLLNATQVSFNDYLDSIGVSKSSASSEGNFRDEFLMAVNFCNNNQDNSQMNGLGGMVNFVSSKGPLFSILGGNYQLIKTAFEQAIQSYQSNKKCETNTLKISQVTTRVTSVVYDKNKNTIELFSNDNSLGHFETVILATPIQFSRISFYIRPLGNNSSLDNMKFNLVSDESYDGRLPPRLTRSYTQVVTTIVSNATWNHTYFNTKFPLQARSFLMTKEGRNDLGVSSVSRLTVDGVYKVFSSNSLSLEKLKSMFGKEVKVEYEKVWGGEFGGATPSFQAGIDPIASVKFLLYEGGENEELGNPAIYYTNDMESAVAAMEISAIGAKAVAKLVSKRLQLIRSSDETKVNEF